MEEVTLPVPCEKKRGRGFFPKTSSFPIVPEGSSSDALSYAGVPHSRRKTFVGHLCESYVVVKDRIGIKTLFSMGFFGMSNLTNRTPFACQDVWKDSLQEIGASESLPVTIESDSESDEDDHHWKRLKLTPSDDQEKESEKDEEDNGNEAEDEGHPKKEKRLKEQLELTFEEAFFLSYTLGVLAVVDGNQHISLLRLWNKLCELTPNGKFPIMYTAYHHLRTKNWVVRSGMNYGVDYVLYKDGPLYYHSTYAVIVKAIREKNLKEILNERLPFTWRSLAAMNRVVSHSGKGLMCLYVVKPEFMSENKIATPFCVSKFKVEEVLISRWVPSASREDDT